LQVVARLTKSAVYCHNAQVLIMSVATVGGRGILYSGRLLSVR